MKCSSSCACSADPVCMGLATGLTLSDVSVAGLLGISESSSYSLGSGSGVCCYSRKTESFIRNPQLMFKTNELNNRKLLESAMMGAESLRW